MFGLKELLLGQNLPHVSQNLFSRLDYPSIFQCREVIPLAFANLNKDLIERKRLVHNLSASCKRETFGLTKVASCHVDKKNYRRVVSQRLLLFIKIIYIELKKAWNTILNLCDRTLFLCANGSYTISDTHKWRCLRLLAAGNARNLRYKHQL